MELTYLRSRMRSNRLFALALAGAATMTFSHAQVYWDANDTDGASGDGAYWHDTGNWIGESLPGTSQDIYLDGENVYVDDSAVYRHVYSGSGGTISIEAGGTVTTYGSYSAIRYLSAGGVSVGGAGLLVDSTDDDGAIRSALTVETGGRVEGYYYARDNDVTLNGGTFAPLGVDTTNKRRFRVDSSSEVDVNTGLIELDVFGDDDAEYFDVIHSTGALTLSQTNGGSIKLVARNGYEPVVGHSYDLWDNTGSGTVTPGDASNVSIENYDAIFDTSAWSSTGVLTIDSFASSAVVVYASDFETDESGTTPFFDEPASLYHDPNATHPDTEDGAMVFGGEGADWESLKIHIPVEEGESYEIITRSSLDGTGSNLADHYVRLVDVDGMTVTVVESSSNLGTGDHQTVLPATGTVPSGVTHVEMYWRLRGVVATGNTREISVHQITVTQLGEDGPRPFYTQSPYIQHHLGYVNEDITVDLTDVFVGTVTTFTNDAGIPMTYTGNSVTFSPTSTLLHSALSISAENEAGVSVQDATLYLQVDAEPATLAANTGLDSNFEAQLINQYVEPDQHLFPIDCKKLFTGGLPPFEYSITSAPTWVEMPVNGLVGGQCPSSITPTSTSIVIQATDARNDTASYTLDLDIIATRDRTPTHTPTTDTAFQSAIETGGNVVQLATNTTYDFGSMYQKANGASSAEDPVIILGASGAVIETGTAFNQSGHFIIEDVTFQMTSETTMVSAKDTAGLRLVNCTFEGHEITVNPAVPPPSGGDWMNSETFRYLGDGVTVRDKSFVVIEDCHFQRFDTSINTLAGAASVGVFDTVSETAADDHCFFQQTYAIWMEDVDLLGHAGNHTEAEHRDVVQFGNANGPPLRNVLLRRVFGYGDGQSQALLAENEIQRIPGNRIPNWLGNHRNVLIEHSVFIGNSVHGISLRGLSNYEVRNCATLGHPDETDPDSSDPAYGQLLVRNINENGVIDDNIMDKQDIENADETDNTNNTLSGNIILDGLNGNDYATNRDIIMPDFDDDTLTMKERCMLDSTWASNNPGVGPDIIRP